LIPKTARNLQESTVPGPNAFFIRIRHGANPTLVGRSLRRIDSTLNASSDGVGGVVGVLRPAEIANYRSIGTVPALLGGAVVLGTVVGVPLGIVAGRTLWNLFARNIHAVPAPSVPILSIVLIALGALILANLVAAIPGRIAARTPTAIILRAE